MATGQKISAQTAVDRLNDGDLGTCVQGGVNKNFNIGAVSCKAWINFDGLTNTINDSFNVASITDNGTGSYTITFTENMASANYVVFGSFAFVARDVSVHPENLAVGSFTIQLVNNGTAADPPAASPDVYVLVFGA